MTRGSHAPLPKFRVLDKRNLARRRRFKARDSFN
jgi:hypothetical protein